ncbi:ABC transporter permease [Amphibacillus sp. Q70]|uniref:ABC transporter permease n=1 Tax=Amphibacillus sp. Q70 TaxID=3453416 RepID=UPI003F857079
MNIINKLTWRHLKENKRRTLVTIIGVVISVAMLTAVSTLAVSFMSLLQRQHIADEGEWHVLYKDVDEEQLAAIHADKNTESVILSRDAGYSDLEESENSFKPYLFLREYNEAGFQQFPIELIEGKMPTNESELLISEHITTDGGIEYEIGDTITLELGERKVDDEEMNQNTIDQSYPLQKRPLSEASDSNGDTVATELTEEVSESIINTISKDFTIVGIMERPEWEPISAPGYTVLTHLPEYYFAVENETINVSVVWDKISRSAVENAEQLGDSLNIEDYSLNSNLLRYYGVISNEFLRTTFYSLVGILMAVIMIGSMSLIYNAFAISVSERSRYLGMLSSVGATKKQKRNSVFFEGAIIGLISIPLGVISGLVGIGITFHFINSLLQDLLEITEELTIVVTPLSIVMACLVSLLTIFMSTYIPARRASRVSAIDAIRQTMDIKMTRKKVKTSRLVRKLFGIEAEFGLKNLKRNKRRYFATVFSLVISIVLFLTVSYFTDQLKQSSNYFVDDFNHDIEITSWISDGGEHQFSDSFIRSITSMDEVTEYSFIQAVDLKTALSENQVPDQLNEFVEDGEYESPINLYVLDKESLQQYAEEIGINDTQLTEEDKMTGIIINKAMAIGEKRGESEAVQMSPGESLEVVYEDYWQGEKETVLGDIEIVALTDKLPLGVQLRHQGQLSMIVSPETFAQLNGNDQISEATYGLYLTSSEPLVIHEKLIELVDNNMHITNYHKIRQEEEQIVLLMSVFIYGFITLITAISVANIFNTISTSISLRKTEFAMLKSVGMTPKGFNKMINYESIFYGIKSLLYGLPISVAVMYAIYEAMMLSFDYPFRLPWLSMLYVVIAVFLIVSSAMLYSGSKVKKENIIEALKQENI